MLLIKSRIEKMHGENNFDCLKKAIELKNNNKFFYRIRSFESAALKLKHVLACDETNHNLAEGAGVWELFSKENSKLFY